MLAQIFIVGDTRTLTAVLSDGSCNPLDLTDQTVNLRYSIAGATTLVRAMTVALPQTNKNKGKCSYTFQTGDLTLPSGVNTQTATADITATNIDGQILTTDIPFKFSVRVRT